MDHIVKGMTQDDQQAKAEKTWKRPGDAWAPGLASNTKGAMREPSQTPGQACGEMEEVKEALHDLEESKGDWSKGGG